jgi:hypothetical protein
MTTSFDLTTGSKVRGLYHDIPYSGEVVEARVDKASFKYLFTVKLDEPINVYSTIRSRIHFSADDFVTIEAV